MTSKKEEGRKNEKEILERTFKIRKKERKKEIIVSMK